MALQGNYTFLDTDLTIVDSYVRIESITIRKEEFICFKAGVFKDKDKNSVLPILDFSVIYGSSEYDNYFSDEKLKESGNNIHTQVYKYLKTLNYFDTMTDV